MVWINLILDEQNNFYGNRFYKYHTGIETLIIKWRLKVMRKSMKKLIILIIIMIVTTLVVACTTDNGDNSKETEKGKDNKAQVYEGYTLFTPLTSGTTYLIDNNGDVVHEWEGEHYPGNSVYLLEDGRLLRTADPGLNGNETFNAGGAGGNVQIFDWEGNILWDFEYSSDEYLLHHDIEYLPNGNILMISWDYKSYDEAVQAGRNPRLLPDGELWSEKIIEVKPTGSNKGEIVWAWYLWDHLIQDHDSTKENYGDVSQHPELVDLNFIGADGPGADWAHINSIDYNEELDQILLSVHSFSEIWIIDHSTTTEEASEHSDGRYGKGGDILYRWGNPQTYGRGKEDDQQFYAQHDAEWIEEGYPGENNIIVYNNGLNRLEEGKDYSTVEEIKSPIDEKGNYRLEEGKSYGPEKPVWLYKADPPEDLYSAYISGCQRLPNGNTLIISGFNGEIREVTKDKEVVWTYTSPYGKEQENEVMRKNSVFKAEKYSPDYPGLKNLEGKK